MSAAKKASPGVIAMTGATGFVGGAALDEALARGWTVRALTRRPREERKGVEWVPGSLEEQASLAELCTGADAALHIAGVVNAHDPAGFEAGNVVGTRRMIETARAAGCRRLVHVSSLAAREPDLSRYGASKRTAEDLVQKSAMSWTIVRPPAVYGPRDTEMLDMFRLAARGFMPLPPGGMLSVIHVADLARLLLMLAEAEEGVEGRIFEPDDGSDEGWTQRGFARAIADAVGKRAYAIHMPRWLMMASAHADRLLRGEKAKLTPDRARYFSHSDWTVERALRPPPGLWLPEIETEEGLAETARWYRERGWLQ